MNREQLIRCRDAFYAVVGARCEFINYFFYRKNILSVLTAERWYKLVICADALCFSIVIHTSGESGFTFDNRALERAFDTKFSSCAKRIRTVCTIQECPSGITADQLATV
ncbi:MAG: hypothetical protein M0R33_15290 [Methylomonas sp.]|jgi:hypothetical protein|uniref:hypothetical protein n=1 Tax=Methylomonas sp. TaxID=418 RepID=UPI0025FB7FA3|nr:hypothetical protein [Methylomonas sp.]MCK9607806.1 hypothetical protein [Methylomonas sp.]